MDIISLIVSLISGAAGGNIAGATMKDKSLGTLGDSISGLLGGGIGGAILQMLGYATSLHTGAGGGLDFEALLASIGSGGVGGGVLMTVIAMVKEAMNKSAPKP